jgi:hypothetical protein
LARFLGLDWDNNQLHLVAVTTGRGGVRVERAAVWQDNFSPGPGRAEAVGQRLREYLRNDGIAAAPALVCVGRDRVILKEIRHPAVPPAEEAALIRFQASKEMAESPESVVIDYTAKSTATNGGEKTAFAFAVRRELPLFLQAVCRAAGLKLLAVTPRGFGVAACLKRSAVTPADNPDAAVAVLTVADGWADFSVVRGEGLLFTRALPAGTNLVAEVRRNLAVYAGQASTNGTKVQALHVAAGDKDVHLVEDLRRALPLPVHMLDPFAPDAHLDFSGDRGGFTGAVGLTAAWAARRAAPVNFVAPKEPVKASNPETRRAVRIGAMVGALLLLLAVLAVWWLNSRKSLLEELQEADAKHDSELQALAPDAKHIDALKDWSGATVSWRNELYDVTARFDSRKGFRLTEFSGTVKQQPSGLAGHAKAPEKKFTSELTLHGEVRPGDEGYAERLKAALTDTHHRAGVQFKTPVAGDSAKKDTKTFTVRMEIAPQPARDYTGTMSLPGPPPPAPKKKSQGPNFTGINDGGQP